MLIQTSGVVVTAAGEQPFDAPWPKDETVSAKPRSVTDHSGKVFAGSWGMCSANIVSLSLSVVLSGRREWILRRLLCKPQGRSAKSTS